MRHPRTTARRVTALGAAAVATLLLAAPSPSDARIIGGYTPHPSQWPWMVALLDTRKGTGDFAQHMCGGALIHPRLVVTAAHCVTRRDTGALEPAGALQVMVGKRQLSAPGGEHLGVSRIVLHARYHEPTTWAHDLAVVHLSADSTRAPAPLIGTQASVAMGTKVTTMGWGNTVSGGTTYVKSDTLKAVDGAVWSDSQCDAAGINETDRGMYRSYYHPDSMICAGWADSAETTCQGDSGSPMMVADTSGTWRLLGMVSWGGIGCHGQTSPTVYAWLGGASMDAFLRQQLSEAAAASAAAASAPAAGSAPAAHPSPVVDGAPAATPGGVAKLVDAQPPAPATAPRFTARLDRSRVRLGRAAVVRGTAGRSGTLHVAAVRGGRTSRVWTVDVHRAGTLSFVVPTGRAGHRLRRGAYRLRMVLRTPSGASAPVTRALRVR